VNIFLSRPFVIGDQVKFAGGSDLEGTVEAVEFMRTLLRTTGGSFEAEQVRAGCFQAGKGRVLPGRAGAPRWIAYSPGCTFHEHAARIPASSTVISSMAVHPT
jgi:hypothetical protein